ISASRASYGQGLSPFFRAALRQGSPARERVTSMRKVRVAIAGVGNCASSLVQGIYYYASPERAQQAAGLMSPDIGGYRPGDVEIVAAFDIDARKVGRPLHEALFAKPNCTPVFHRDIPDTGVVVQMGPVLDGASSHMQDYPEDRTFKVADLPPVDVAKVLRETRADVLVGYLRVGSEEASFYYAEVALRAGAAFVYAIPVFIASNPQWADRFRRKNLPIFGDNIKSQVGATIVHRVLTRLFK